MNDDDRLQRLIPLKPVDYLVLLVLAREERHGYGIVQDVERESAGRIQLEPGNLYRTIRRLSRWGLLRETDRRPAPESDDQRRRYYCLTALGRRAVLSETERLRALIQYADRMSWASEEN